MTVRGINKLTALQVKKAKANPDKMYKLPDGGNLYLRIDSSGSKYWIFNYTRPYIAKRNDLSLGTYPEVMLEEARTIRDEYKKLIKQGIDPANVRLETKNQKKKEAENTFRVVSAEWLKKRELEGKQDEETNRRLNHDAYPYIGDMSFPQLTLDVLEAKVFQRIIDREALSVAKRLKSDLNQIFKSARKKMLILQVRMIFNDPELNLRAEYSLFDRQTGRPVCVGNGETCQRQTSQGIEQHPCPSPDLCPLAQGGNCKPYGRLHVNLDESDELGTFIFRTTGFNSIRTLAARLSYYHAASNGLLSCLPLQLTLRGKSTTQSYRTPVYYVDLTLRDGVNLKEAIQTAKEIDQHSKQSGFNQSALDQMARQGYGNAQFEVSSEEGADLVEEFYTDQIVEAEQVQAETLNTAKSNQDDGFVQDIQQSLQQSVRAVN